MIATDRQENRTGPRRRVRFELTYRAVTVGAPRDVGPHLDQHVAPVMLADAAARPHDDVCLAAIVQPLTSSNVEAESLEVVRDVALVGQLVGATPLGPPSLEGGHDLRKE